MADRRPAAQPSTDSVGSVIRLSRRRPLHIAMIGQRGAPATFGGVEHHVEELGARFAKWRATYSISDTLPSEYCIWTNAHALARRRS